MEEHHRNALGFFGWAGSGVAAHIVGINEGLQALWYIVGIVILVLTYLTAKKK